MFYMIFLGRQAHPCYLPYLWNFRKYTTTTMTTNARHTPPPAAIPASIAISDGDSSGANKQNKEYKHFFL